MLGQGGCPVRTDVSRTKTPPIGTVPKWCGKLRMALLASAIPRAYRGGRMGKPASINPRIIEGLYCEALVLSDEVRAAFALSGRLDAAANEDEA